MTQSTCTIDGCEKTPYVRAWCNGHYKRWLRYGDPLGAPVRPTPQERFWSKVNKTDGCWEWTGAANHLRYGTFHLRGKFRGVHTVSWEWANGPIPAGMEIDHVCHNPACVNPDHLRLATRKQNVENRQGAARNNKGSGVRGVYPTTNDKWFARVGHNGRLIYLGTYDTIEEASAVVAAARRNLFTHSQN